MTDLTTTFSADAVSALLEQWQAERPTGLIAHRVVIDRLLDLRNLIPDERRLLVDAVLVDLPGRSVVDSAWWNERVTELRLLLTDRAA